MVCRHWSGLRREWWDRRVLVVRRRRSTILSRGCGRLFLYRLMGLVRSTLVMIGLVGFGIRLWLDFDLGLDVAVGLSWC